jgi:predicted dehydrogenase
MKTLKIGIIGCGRISDMHLISASSLAQSELVACCDIKKERADAVAKQYGIRAYGSYEEMIDNEELECYPVAILESYEEVIRIYCLKGNPDMVYLVSKDYDSNDDKTTYCLNVLVKLD